MFKGMIVGLGNPGGRYAFTRHNIGFMVLDCLCRKFQEEISPLAAKKSCYQLYLWKRLGSGDVWLLCRPLTYMNLSGQAVTSLLGSRKFSREMPLLVVHDELDLPYGVLRLKNGGGLAGHNGLKSIAHCLGSKDFSRLRVGIGRPLDNIPLADYVLSEFTSVERVELASVLERACVGVQLFCDKGIERAMNEFNRKA